MGDVDAEKAGVDVGPHSSTPSAWVLWWQYYDGSSAEVCRVYINRERANEDFDLVRDGDDGKKWELTETFIYGDGDAKLSSSADLSEQRHEP